MDARETPILEINLKLQGVSTEQVLKSSADIRQLTGTMYLTGNFKGSGFSQRQWMSTLSGEATLGSENGMIIGIDMPRLAERMDSLDTLGAFMNVLDTALEGGETPYRFISTEAKLTDGVISFEKIDGDIEATELGGRGRIDLPGWNMDVSGAIRLKDKPDVPAIGYSLRGPVDEPAVKYDYIALTAYMTRHFTSTLFQQLLSTPVPEEETLSPEGEGVEGETPAPAETEPEPSPEEQIIRGLFELLTGPKEEPEEEEEGEGGG